MMKDNLKLISAISGLFKKFGLMQGLLGFTLALLFFKGSQRHIDFLFDAIFFTDIDNKRPFYIFIGVLILFVVIDWLYKFFTVGKYKDELERCSEEKTKLQEQLLSKERLNSTKKQKK